MPPPPLARRVRLRRPDGRASSRAARDRGGGESLVTSPRSERGRRGRADLPCRSPARVRCAARRATPATSATRRRRAQARGRRVRRARPPRSAQAPRAGPAPGRGRRRRRPSLGPQHEAVAPSRDKRSCESQLRKAIADANDTRGRLGRAVAEVDARRQSPRRRARRRPGAGRSAPGVTSASPGRRPASAAAEGERDALSRIGAPTARPCTSTLRTRTSFPPGCACSSSPSRDPPDQSVPVTTARSPKLKERST